MPELPPNTDFVVTYKCRLCGELVDKGHTGEGVAMTICAMVTFHGKPAEVIGGRIGLLDYHRCPTGSLGLCDLQGIVANADAQNSHGNKD